VATYYDIFGQKVQYLSSDPANLTEGQVWYNSTSNTAKFQGLGTASWATGGSRNYYTFKGAGFGTITDAVASGGTGTPPGFVPSGPINNGTETYDGTSWSPGTNAPLNLGYVTSGGTSSAGIVNTGESPPGSGTTTIEYASGTWTSGGTQNYAAQNAIGAGTQISYIQAGGVFQPDYSAKNNADSYDGTSWTTITVYPANIERGGGAGDASTAFFYGGSPSAPVGTLTNDWNGSAWTAASVIPTASVNMAQNNSGPVNGALNAAIGSTTTCLLYNGTTWSTDQSSSNLSPEGLSGAGGDLPTTGLLKWGSPGANSLIVEEYTGAAPTTVTFSSS